VDDVVSAYMKAIEYIVKKENKDNEVFFVGSGKGKKLRDIVSTFEEAASKKLNINWGKRPYRFREVMMAQADIELIKEKLGWQPQLSLKDGIEKVLKDEGLI